MVKGNRLGHSVASFGTHITAPLTHTDTHMNSKYKNIKSISTSSFLPSVDSGDMLLHVEYNYISLRCWPYGTRPSINSFNHTTASKICSFSHENELLSLVFCYLKTKIHFIVNTKKVKNFFVHSQP